jgi:hypothetical protein
MVGEVAKKIFLSNLLKRSKQEVEFSAFTRYFIEMVSRRPGFSSLSTKLQFDACKSRLIFSQGTMNVGNLGSSTLTITAGDGLLGFSVNS